MTSYTEIARAMKEKGWSVNAKEIGEALARNTEPPDRVPCHRVIKNNHTLGAYEDSWDPKVIAKKRDLLRDEGVLFKETDPLHKSILKNPDQFYRFD